MVDKSKIKEISMMVYRKYTEDFDSLGYRLGITFEVKDGDARDAWYQGRLFLGERITEEELLIDKKFKWLKEKKKGFPDVKVETDVIKVKSKPEGMNLVEIPQENEILYDIKELPQYKGEISEENAEYLEDVLKNVVSDVIKASSSKSVERGIKRIMFETDLSKDEVEIMITNKQGELKGLINREGALFIVGKELGVSMKMETKSKEGEERTAIDVKKIIATTPKAVLVAMFDERQIWIPKSCIESGGTIDNLEKNVKTMLFVDKWFLEKEGILSKY